MAWTYFCHSTSRARASPDAEVLERRVLLASTAVGPSPGEVVQRVTQVYVGGTAWTTAFKDFLEAGGVGDGAYGYALSTPFGDLRELPWSNINQVSVRFAEDQTVARDDLTVASATGKAYAVTAFAYDPDDDVATWTFDKPLADFGAGGRGAADDVRFLLTDRGGAGGAAGGTALHLFRVRVVPGDANRSGAVTPADYGLVRSGVGRNTADVGTTPRDYTAFKDVNGDGAVSPADLGVVRGNAGAVLPRFPGAAAVFPTGGATGDLFGDRRV